MMDNNNLFLLLHILFFFYQPFNRCIQHPFFFLLVPNDIKLLTAYITEEILVIDLYEVLHLFFFGVFVFLVVVVIQRVLIFVIFLSFVYPVIHILEAFTELHDLLLLPIMYLLLILKMIVQMLHELCLTLGPDTTDITL